jgi:hypothetical protein
VEELVDERVRVHQNQAPRGDAGSHGVLGSG